MHIFDISFFWFHIAPTWYGLMYALGFGICYLFYRKYGKLSEEETDNLLMYVFFGVILGGRIGYVILYNPSFFLSHPEEILAIWKWWMSFHGGFLGVIIAIYTFCIRHKKWFFEIMDPLAIIIPIALWLGRVWNWINGELPWYGGYSGIFPMVLNGESHFPSPLLEMMLEWVLLWGISFWIWYKKKYPIWTGVYSGIFLIGYSTMRLIAEVFRLPDSHVGYIFWTEWITLGIIYTFPMFVLWWWIIWISRVPQTESSQEG